NSLSVRCGYLGLIVRRQRIDDPGDLDNPAERNTAEFGMLAYLLFAFAQVYAEGLVAGDIAVLPVKILDLGDRRIGGARRPAKFNHRHALDAGNVPFDQVSFQNGHFISPRPTRAAQTIAGAGSRPKPKFLCITKENL